MGLFLKYLADYAFRMTALLAALTALAVVARGFLFGLSAAISPDFLAQIAISFARFWLGMMLLLVMLSALAAWRERHKSLNGN